MEHANPLAAKHHKERTLYYMVEKGLPETEAIERADFDLIEWSKPLPLPDYKEEEELVGEEITDIGPLLDEALGK